MADVIGDVMADVVFVNTVWRVNVPFSPTTLDKRASHVFTHGWCHVFALALSAKTNWELWIGLMDGLINTRGNITDLSQLNDQELLELWNHVVCRTSDGLFADVNGFHMTDPQIGGPKLRYFKIGKDRLQKCISVSDSSFMEPSETIVSAADRLVEVWLKNEIP